MINFSKFDNRELVRLFRLVTSVKSPKVSEHDKALLLLDIKVEAFDRVLAML